MAGWTCRDRDLIEWDGTIKAKRLIGNNGTIEEVPVNNSDIANKAYVDSKTSDLRNDSMADALHRHSELSASDGTPNPALSVDAAGNVGIGTTSPGAKLNILSSVEAAPAVLIRKGYPYGTGEYSDILTIKDKDSTYTLFDISSEGNAYFNFGPTRILSIYNGSVGIGTTSPTNGVLEVVGQVYGSANCSMLSYTDRTPYPENLQVAYEAIDSVAGLNGTIDKSKLHPILKDKEDRNLSMTVSVLLEVIKDLKKRIEVLETPKYI